MVNVVLDIYADVKIGRKSEKWQHLKLVAPSENVYVH